MFGSSKNVSVIAAGMKVVGDVVGGGNFRVSGDIEGTLTASWKIEVDKTGNVQGDIHCSELVVSGEIRGNVRAKKLVLTSTGRIFGDINVEKITVDEGGRFHGKCEFVNTDTVSQATEVVENV